MSISQFSPVALQESLIAARALTQLNRYATFARTTFGSFTDQVAERGDIVTGRRPRTYAAAEDLDPRGGLNGTVAEPEYASFQFKLERLFSNGFPVYHPDLARSVGRYVEEYGNQVGASITKAFEDYVPSKARDYSMIPTTGSYALVNCGFLTVIPSLTSDRTALTDLEATVLSKANGALSSRDVPIADSDNMFFVMPPFVNSSFIGDATLINSFVAAFGAGGPTILQRGLPSGQFLQRYGFNCTQSNANVLTAGQAAVSPILSGGSAFANITAAVANTQILNGDVAGTPPLGAVTLTLGSSGSLGSGVAVGQIARITPQSTTVAKAYGVILRIDAANRTVVLLPIAPSGRVLALAEITAGASDDRLSIPLIPNISLAYHREALAFETRRINAPSEGSGATGQIQVDPNLGLAIQVFSGNFDIDKITSKRRGYLLCGAICTDWRKGVIVISN